MHQGDAASDHDSCDYYYQDDSAAFFHSRSSASVRVLIQ
jgi:hypothetical protein